MKTSKHRRALLRPLALTATLTCGWMVVPAAPFQEDEQEPVRDPLTADGLLGFQAEQQRTLSEALIGDWQLIGFDHVVNDFSDSPIAGQMSVSESGYLHIIIHTQDPEPLVFENPLLIQAGVHHWRIDERGVLLTATLMAHTNFDRDLVSEPTYNPREYQLRFMLENQYVNLERPDGSRLRFQRLGNSVFPAVATERLRAIRAGRSPFEVGR
ncbi:MAG: hypothetical protein ACYSWX_03480 [Planctomycetota bacterium]|jgi:hypothetical protein